MKINRQQRYTQQCSIAIALYLPIWEICKYKNRSFIPKWNGKVLWKRNYLDTNPLGSKSTKRSFRGEKKWEMKQRSNLCDVKQRDIEPYT